MSSKYFITGILCLMIFFKALGQETEGPKDSVIFEVPDKFYIIIRVDDYQNIKNNIDVSQVIMDFQNDLKQVAGNLPETGPYVINYQHKALLEFQERPLVNKFKVENGRVSSLKLFNQCIITASNISILIKFNHYNDLLDSHLPFAINQVANKLPVGHRFLKTLRYKATDLNSEPVLKEEKIHTNKSLDMLSLLGGVGANAIYNKYLTDVTGEIGLQLNRKGILKNQIYLSNNLLFNFNSEGKVVLNNFTNIGFRRNFSNDQEKPDWLGLEFGKLTSRSGEFFPKNTYKIGVNWDVGKHVQVTPTIYFSDLFKQVSPGVRIGFGI